jgi:hypothetical protein
MNEKEHHGYIVAIKDSFGFIQPFFSEEQIFFSGKDFYEEMKIGELVRYQLQPGAGSTKAMKMSPIVGSRGITQANVEGTIVSTCDRNRNLYGILEMKTIDAVSVMVAYQSSDIRSSSMPKNHQPLEKGDIVEFDLAICSDCSSLYIADNIRFKMSRRDHASAGNT